MYILREIIICLTGPYTISITYFNIKTFNNSKTKIDLLGENNKNKMIYLMIE